MNESIKEEFLKYYHEIIGDNGNVILCGRNKCKYLIQLCNQLDSSTDFGDLSTGFMNVSNIVALYDKIRTNA